MSFQLDNAVLKKILKLTNGCRTPSSQFNAWRDVFEVFKPKRYLEIGSFKGRSLFLASFLSKAYEIKSASYAFTCIDSWEGGDEHKVAGMDMISSESCFDKVMSICQEFVAPGGANFEKIKALSRFGLLKLQERVGFYDLIFIDASHRTKDVLTDAILAWPLLRKGGVMIFDDYTWTANHASLGSVLESPRLGIDSFIACHADELTIISQLPLLQLYLVKDVFPAYYGYSVARSKLQFQELTTSGIVIE